MMSSVCLIISLASLDSLIDTIVVKSKRSCQSTRRNWWKNWHALALLSSTMNEENTRKIINCENFKDAWETIGKCFENKTTYEPQALYRRLNSYKINSASEVSSGIVKFVR